jgi:succinyl-diaminopimelate desuccinylase
LAAAQTLEQVPVDIPIEVKQLVEDTKLSLQSQFGKDAGRIADHIVVNPDTIKGGVKVNMVPAYCEAELDTRAPWGVSSEQVRLELEKRVRDAGVGDIKIEFLIRNEPNFTSPNDKLIQAIRNNIKLQTSKEPRVTLIVGLTDLRFWRRKGIPAACYGPTSYGMAAADEYITVEDLLTVTRVHAGTMIDYFGL